MTVYDFLYLCTDDSVVIQIWDQAQESIVAVCEIRDAMYGDYADYELDSFDICEQGLILNIDTGE